MSAVKSCGATHRHSEQTRQEDFQSPWRAQNRSVSYGVAYIVHIVRKWLIKQFRHYTVILHAANNTKFWLWSFKGIVSIKMGVE